jgi:hypothetical protein
MKRYTDLTTEELANLSSEMIQKFIEIEVAFAGVKMMPKPLPYEPFNFQVKPAMKAYSVKGVLVASREVAEILQNAVVYKEQYNYPDYDHKYLEEQTTREIDEREFYLKQDLEAVKSQVATTKKAEEEFRAANKLFCEYEQQTDAFKAEVLEVVNEARRIMDRQRQAQAAYDKYLNLADGNEIIAKKFFRDAFLSYPDMVEFILGETPSPVVEEEINETSE